MVGVLDAMGLTELVTSIPGMSAVGAAVITGRDTRREIVMTDGELARLQRRYRALLDQIRDLGFVATGSVIERYTTCTKAGCRCHAGPPQRHGPYQQYTRKIAGKTVTVRLEQAQHYREQITNRCRLDEIIAAMEDVSAQAPDAPLTPQPSHSRSRKAGPTS